MKALFITEPLSSRLGETADPAVGYGDVLLQIQVIGFCGTDLNTFRGKNPLVSYPRIPGHEIAATIVMAGPGVPATLHAGRNVAVLPYNNCGSCAACGRRRPNACLANKTLGVQQDGALSTYFTVPWQKLYAADRLSLPELALVEPLAVGFHAVSRGRVDAGDVVAVIGSGTVGLGAIAAAAARHAKVIAIDLDNAKLELAHMAGAEESINSRTEDARARLKELTEGHGPDVVIEAVGTPATFRFAVEEVAYTGRVVYIGYAKEPVDYETRLFILKELDILGSRNSATEFPKVIDALESGRFPVEAAISKTVPFAEAGQALADWNHNPEAYTKIQVNVNE